MARRYRKKRSHGKRRKMNMSYVRSFIGKGRRKGSRRIKRGIRKIT